VNELVKESKEWYSVLISGENGTCSQVPWTGIDLSHYLVNAHKDHWRSLGIEVGTVPTCPHVRPHHSACLAWLERDIHLGGMTGATQRASVLYLACATCCNLWARTAAGGHAVDESSKVVGPWIQFHGISVLHCHKLRVAEDQVTAAHWDLVSVAATDLGLRVNMEYFRPYKALLVARNSQSEPKEVLLPESLPEHLYEINVRTDP